MSMPRSGPTMCVGAMLWLLLVEPCAAQAPGAAPLARYSEVGPAACWRPPKDSAGMEITLIFSFKRDGTLLGEPRIGFSKLLGDQDLQKRFVASALTALARCAPLKFSPGLAGAIAGRPFSMRFKTDASAGDV